MMEEENIDLSISIEPSDLTSECCGAPVEINLEFVHSASTCTKCKKECDWSLDNN